MKIAAVELRRIRLPLVQPFRTSSGTQTSRDVLLVRVIAPDTEGWGECVALEQPHYTSEYTDGAAHVIQHHLLPPLLAANTVTAEQVAARLSHVRGHRMAKGALELAILDAQLRLTGESLGAALGGATDRVPCGVSVGIFDSVPALLDTVAGYVDAGYLRIKLKIEPGWDVEPVAALRQHFGDDLLLQVDANGAYLLEDASHLARLDRYNLALIEQPLPEEHLLAHAELARRIGTPICLDESIVSAQTAADAIALGACRIVNIKAGRVGGYLEARQIHDLCAARGVPVWCGGMLETGIGRAANVALASLPNFTLPGDVSPSGRFYERDIVEEPFVMHDGHLRVPTGPGLGVSLDRAFLDEVTTSTATISA